MRTQEVETSVAEERELVEMIDRMFLAEGLLVEMIGMISHAEGSIEEEIRKGGATSARLQGAGGLLQALSVAVQASLIPAGDAGALSAFAQLALADGDAGSPTAAAHGSKSGGILQALQNLQDKAGCQLEEIRLKNDGAQGRYQRLIQSLESQVGVVSGVCSGLDGQ